MDAITLALAKQYTDKQAGGSGGGGGGVLPIVEITTQAVVGSEVELSLAESKMLTSALNQKIPFVLRLYDQSVIGGASLFGVGSIVVLEGSGMSGLCSVDIVTIEFRINFDNGMWTMTFTME